MATHKLPAPLSHPITAPAALLHAQMMLKKSKGITWPLAFLALATTIVYMAGLASLQHNCDELTGLSQARIVGRSAFGISDMFQCHRMLRFYWSVPWLRCAGPCVSV